MINRILIIVLICFSSQCFAVEENPLKHFLDGLNTLEANFSQTLFNESGDQLENTKGVLFLTQPDKFYWSYEYPYSQQIISDGNVLWVYDKDLEQLTIKNMKNDLSQSPAGIILGNSDIEKHYIEVNLGDIDGYNWVELTSREIESQYRSIKIGFNDNKLGMLIIHDSLGQITRIDFSDVKRNIDIDDVKFTFNPPAGIDVIDEREMN